MKRIKKNSIRLQKNYRLWCKCMALGERTGCHQLPERSFCFRGYQLPVCARCTGVIIGYLLAVPVCILSGINRCISILGCICMLADWTLQACKIKPSTNTRRFITGILGDYGIMSVQIGLIKKFILMLRNLREVEHYA